MKFPLSVFIALISALSGSSSFECGRRKININQVIVRGQDTSPGDWPWHGAVFHRKGWSETYACGGTLIGEKFFLTVDHCTKGDNGYGLSSIFVRLGLYNLREPDLHTLQQHNVLRVHRFGTGEGIRNDIAILELDTVVQFTDYVQPACINEVSDLSGQSGVAIGWGVTETDELSSVLKSSWMPVISTNQCLESDRDTFGATLDSSLFCAGFTNGTSVCNGDSGGGLHFERGGAWYVGGLVAYTAVRDSTNRCKRNGYAGFTNVFHFLPWIWNVTKLQSLATKVMVYNGEDPVPSKTYRNYLPRNCGPTIVNRIARGQSAELYEFPWMARLESKKYSIRKNTLYSCTGSLISKRYVLTTMQCSRYPTPFQVRLGDYDIRSEKDCNINDSSDCAPSTQIYDIEYVVHHQRYSHETWHNDIALIRTRNEVTFDDHIQPVCLPVTTQLQQMTHSSYTIAGWGATSNKYHIQHEGIIVEKLPALQSILQKATVPATNCSTRTIERMKFPFDPVSQICTEPTSSSSPVACIWDEGGLLGSTVQYKGPRFVQYGVTSYGEVDCGTGPWIYTNVAHFMDWIRANMKE